MNEIYFTSDNHFGHKRILEFQSEAGTRHGNNSDEMNELMIQKWNSHVTYSDTVYCLGDFSFMNEDKTINVLSRLNGRIHLIIGNHDMWIGDDSIKMLESVQHYKKLKIDKIDVIMFHYPIHEWEKMHHGSYHLYGHVHGSNKNRGRSMDVGIDAREQKDMGLWHWDEIHENLKNREIIGHHGKYST